MPYIEPDVLKQARQVDLLSYLQTNEPGNLVRISGNNYCTRDHDSLKIINGKWHWFSRGIGGVSALDYLIKVRDYTLPQAVEALVGPGSITPFPRTQTPVKKEPRKLLMPELEKYIDDAAIAGLSQIRIIHGMGTGALRNAVHEELKRNPHVESYRLGEQGEGGYGATVAILR